jgi:ABC-type antimicrobial peptide transport system permease subunit
MSAPLTIPRQAWKQAFGSKKDLPHRYRTSVVRIGAIAILASLIMMFWAANVESTEGTARYYQTNAYDYMVIGKGVRSAMESSVINPELMAQLKQTDDVRAYGVTNYFGKLGSRDVMFMMYVPDSGLQPPLASGRQLKTDNETVIDQDLASALGLKLGDNAKLVGKPYKVVGLSRETGSFGKELVFISEASMFKLYGDTEMYNSIAVDTGGHPLDSELIKKWDKQYDFITKKQYVDGNIDYWTRNVSGLLFTIIAVVTLLGLIGLTVIVSKQVDLQMQDIGLKRAVGMSRKQASALEALVLAMLVFVGWVIAIPLGWLLIGLLNASTPGFHASLSLQTMLVAALCLVPISLFVIWRLWRKVGRINPVDQMRSS